MQTSFVKKWDGEGEGEPRAERLGLYEVKLCVAGEWRVNMVKVLPSYHLLGSAPARPLCLLRARLAALNSSVASNVAGFTGFDHLGAS